MIAAALTAGAANLEVKPDKQNVVASRLEGTWQANEALTKRLIGDSKKRSESPRGVLTFKSDPAILQQLPVKYEKFLKDKQIYMAGIMEVNGERHPFLLIELKGNPHIVWFRDIGGEPMDDSESFIVMFASAADKKNDILLIGGDFNNEPFRAYERKPADEKPAEEDAKK